MLWHLCFAFFFHVYLYTQTQQPFHRQVRTINTYIRICILNFMEINTNSTRWSLYIYVMNIQRMSKKKNKQGYIHVGTIFECPVNSVITLKSVFRTIFINLICPIGLTIIVVCVSKKHMSKTYLYSFFKIILTFDSISSFYCEWPAMDPMNSHRENNL